MKTSFQILLILFFISFLSLKADTQVVSTSSAKHIYMNQPVLLGWTDNEKTTADVKNILQKHHIDCFSYCELVYCVQVDKSNIKTASALIDEKMNSYPSLKRFQIANDFPENK